MVLAEGVSVEGKASLGDEDVEGDVWVHGAFILGPGRNAEIGRIYNLGEEVCVCVEYSQPRGGSAENT